MSRVKRLSRAEYGKVITTVYRKTWYGRWKLLVEYTMYEVRVRRRHWDTSPADVWGTPMGLTTKMETVYQQVINIDNR